MTRYFLALGSNLGDREANLGAAIQQLGRHDIAVTRSASVYTTEPKGMRDQPWFLNTVVEIETPLGPDDLMRRCLEVEASLGRERGEPDGPRTIDIDIILAGRSVVKTGLVTIPHPRYRERRFVLEPLAELAPGALDPEQGIAVREILDRLSDPGVVHRTGPPLV